MKKRAKYKVRLATNRWATTSLPYYSTATSIQLLVRWVLLTTSLPYYPATASSVNRVVLYRASGVDWRASYRSHEPAPPTNNTVLAAVSRLSCTWPSIQALKSTVLQCMYISQSHDQPGYLAHHTQIGAISPTSCEMWPKYCETVETSCTSL